MDASDIAELRADIRGAVLGPGEAGFDAACEGFNLARRHQPDLAVIPESVDDVVAAVRLADRLGMPIQVQASGHGIGAPAEDGLLVNTSKLQTVSIDPERRTARVSAGVRWHQVIAAASEHGLAPLNGSSLTVGVVGYTLGGGMGPMGRTFGFAADHVRRAQLVTARGELVEVDALSDPDLFWALRGGKCSVGIVTELEFDLMPVADVYGGAVFYPGESAAAVLHAYRSWTLTLPETTTTSIALLRLPDIDEVPAPLRGRLSIHLRYVHVGTDADGEDLLAPMLAVSEPVVNLVGRMPYLAIGSVHQDPEEPLPVWDGSVLLNELPAAAVDALLATAGPERDVPLLLAEIRHLGGALARPPAGANAVGGRDAAFSVYVVGPYPPPLRKAVAAAGSSVLDAMEPWSTGHTQINFAGSATNPEQVRRAWSDDTLARLRTVKQAWDPAGRFRFGYSID